MPHGMSEMTIEQYYEKHAIDGRAILSGTRDHPQRWIVLVSGLVGDLYCLCSANAMAIRFVNENAHIEDIRRRWCMPHGDKKSYEVGAY